ncbi:DNA polymerase epsilon subunit 2 [Orussus abietinus]|uniref:DNA polymerase epsilon subunit 2 n=1 Tax=Orussus abietinus TaxID=222816 RepID=UPI00062650E8|nr:DNA polymerase epsilon subunit 2 [Orussus abietinus]
MGNEELVRNVKTTFSMYGMILSKELCGILAKHLKTIEESKRDSYLNEITEQVLSHQVENSHITIEHIKHAITECLKPESSLQDTETVINVINAFDIPKLKYNTDRKQYELKKVEKDLYADAIYKPLLFKDRFSILWYRTLRHEMFTPIQFGQKDASKCELTAIEYLFSESKSDNVFVMGMLCQLTEGDYYLEDSNRVVKVNLHNTKFQAELLTEGCIVIANGDYINDVLHVKNMAFPPAELSSNSRAHLGNMNTFGGPHPISLKTSEKLKTHELTVGSEAMIIFVSDLWVDDALVLIKFKTMIEGYSDDPPVAFVFCGQFTSTPLNAGSIETVKDGFKQLANIVEQHSDIKQFSKFIFVPSLQDIGTPKILPKGSLPEYIVEDFSKRVPGTILATNPCRIQYCTKEIIVFRENMISKMRRNTIIFNDAEEIEKHFAKMIICQAHLAPLTLSVSAVYWKHDYALQIYPTPDLIVVADQYEPYETEYNGCLVINPGSFPKNNFSFKTYIPSRNLIEHCEIPSESDS